MTALADRAPPESDGPVPALAGGAVHLAPSQRAVARVLGRLLDDLPSRETRPELGSPRLRVLDLRLRLLRAHVFEDPGPLLRRLKRRGLLRERRGPPGDRAFDLPYPDVLRQFLGATEARAQAALPVPGAAELDEESTVRALDTEFRHRLREVLEGRLPQTLEFGASFNVQRLSEYLRQLFGEALYRDALVALLQQYALADVPLLAPNGRVTGTTGFHLALFGPPGTGKTFSIDDLVRGNPRSGVPAHGLPGRNRYCGGITPAQFLRVGASYADRTFNFIVPEFNDWFRYRGMVEPLKLVMEQREVKWETTFGTIGPYTFRSFFSVNYNTRAGGSGDYWASIADPNFAALEDRMLLRFQPMTPDRFRAVETSAERLELGEIDFTLAESIRDHLTLVHGLETGAARVPGWSGTRPVTLQRGLYDRLRQVSDRALQQDREPRYSPRLRSRAVRLAAAARLVGALQGPPEAALTVSPAEVDLAAEIYEAEIAARSGPTGRSSSGTLRPTADGQPSLRSVNRANGTRGG